MADQAKRKVLGLRELESSSLSEFKDPDVNLVSPVIGQIKDIPNEGILLVEWGDDNLAEARASASLETYPRDALVGREVLLLFENNDPKKPIAITLLQPISDIGQNLADAAKNKDTPQVFFDGEEVVIKARKKIELRVGRASIVIDENGKITTKGEHLLNRATGPIRIKGGHVDIN